jgi:membrane-bound lytic murein transglycosylase A
MTSASFTLQSASFSELPGWEADDPCALQAAMADCLHYLQAGKPYKMGALGLTAAFAKGKCIEKS